MRCLFALSIALLLSLPAHAATHAAVVVGANAASPGRTALRYAHRDAASFAATLVEVADFPADGIDLLLEASPAEILAALDRRLAALRLAPGETMLLFYFSGHADGHALYSGGAPLPLRDLKERLSDSAAGVRVGIVDACSGGAWTGAKGLRPAAEFEVNLPLTLGSEGSALLAANSGHGDAHESELIGGSFFTHHLVAALRGVGDRVTLSVGAAVDQPWTDPRRSRGGDGGRWTPRGAEIELGSVLRLGSARVPIAAVELFEGVFVDGYAAVRIDPRSGAMEESFLGGVTWMP